MDFKDLVKTVALRKAQEEKINQLKAQFEETIKLDKAILDDLIAEEELKRNEALAFMKEQNLEKETVDNFTVTRNVKYTNQIKDTYRLQEAIASNKEKIIAMGVQETDLMGLFEDQLVVTDKKLATAIVNNFEKLENELLDGCEKKATEFVTIAEQQ